MRKSIVYHEFLNYNDADLFTVVCLPEKSGTFPTVIYRTPYVDDTVSQPVEEICEAKHNE